MMAIDRDTSTATRTPKARRSKGLLTVGLVGALASVVLTAPAFAQTVTVQGNSRTDTDTIRSYLQLAPGQSYTAARIDQAMKDLYATGLFSDVRISRAGNGVVVRVTENTVINRVSFEGNSKVKTELLQGEIQSRSRGPYSQALVDNDVQRLMEIYRRSGRGDAQISARTATAANGRVDVTYVIKEGSKTGISAIEFVGNRAYSAGKLRNLMETSESGLFGFFKSTDIYDPDRLASDLDRIRRFYLKNGYADFRVLSSGAEYDPVKKGYVVSIAIEEGEQYRVAGVDVDSRVRDVDSAQLRRVVRTSTGDVYNAEAVEKSVEALAGETAKRGYAFTQVRPRGDRDPATRTVNIVYSVEEGPRVYVERINVRGNTRTRDNVIRREFEMGEGDAYNKVYVDRAERRLKALGYFKTVKVSSEQGSAPDRVVVNVDVEDQSTGSFSIAGGYSTTDGMLAEASIQENNFLGRGQFVKVSVSNGQRARGAEFSFTEPFFLDRRLAAGFDIFSKQTFNSQFARHETRTTGGTLRMSLPFNEEFSVGVRYSLYSQKLTIPNEYDRPYNDCSSPLGDGITTVNGLNYCMYNGEASIAVKEAQGSTITSLAGLTFLYNSLDNPRNPTSGIYAELRPEVAGLGGDSKFFRFTGDMRYYYPISDEITGILRVQGGHIAGFGGGTKGALGSVGGDVRMIDHFFLGPTLVRGFSPGGIGPRDMNADPSGNSLGGTSYYGVSAEAQFDIPFLPRELGLRGAVFADAGTVFGYKGARYFDINQNGVIDGVGAGGVCALSGSTLFAPQSECANVRDKNMIRSSVGASVLWQSPLGPIRFDYAYALTKDKGLLDPTTGLRFGKDQLQAFRFSGGARF